MLSIPNLLHTILARYIPTLMSADFYSKKLFTVIKMDKSYQLVTYEITNSIDIRTSYNYHSDVKLMIGVNKSMLPEIEQYMSIWYPESLL